MVQRLQFWVDRADAALRAKYPTRLANIPKPQLYVDTSDVDEFLFGPTNALTRYRQICLPQAAKLAKPGFKDMPRLGLLNNGVLVPVVDCLDRSEYAKAHAAVVAAFDKGSQSCKVTDGTSTLTFGAKCLYAVEFTGGPKSAKATAYPAMSSYIAFEPGLIKTFANEDALVFALYHELGHYYDAHLSVAADYYNYFYSLERAPAGAKPAPDSHYATLTSSVRSTLQANAVQKFQNRFEDENAKVASEHLGYYTVEQEADDFSIEVMTLVGIDPTLAVSALLDLGAAWEKEHGAVDGELTAAQCSTLAAAGWKDTAGKPALVPLGTIYNPHHSPCFRAWNVAREIVGHGYKVAAGAQPTPPGPTWKTLLGQL